MHSVFLPTRNDQALGQSETVATPRPKPELKWPIWATALSYFKSDSDLGVGDTIERIIGKSNSAAFKAWHLKTFGKTCGCSERKTLWNDKFPYNQR